MILQQYGSITVPEGAPYDAMLCQDSDEPDRAQITWWQSKNPSDSGGALVQLIPEGEILRLKLIQLYRSNERGALFAPNLSTQEWNLYSSFNAFLKPGPLGYNGTWVSPTEGRSGHLGFVHVGRVTNEMWAVETCADWDHFKQWAARIRREDRSAAFRGHGSNKFRLEPTIHRHGRLRLHRYRYETLAEFKNHVEAATTMSFELENFNDIKTLLGLAQHHGLPTPLLDFTDSPYIAAYFAFSDAVEHQRDDVTYVRVYALRGDYLASIAHHSFELSTARPYIASLSFSARHNPRLYAQQGRFLATNVSNMEEWLQSMHPGAIRAADIPVDCAVTALEDLKYMGLTSATLFPGLDGICRMMRQTLTLNNRGRPVQLMPSTLSESAHASA